MRTVKKKAKAENALKRQGMLGYMANPDLDSADFNTNHNSSFLSFPATRESFLSFNSHPGEDAAEETSCLIHSVLCLFARKFQQQPSGSP